MCFTVLTKEEFQITFLEATRGLEFIGEDDV